MVRMRKTTTKRRHKKMIVGKERKRVLRNKGSTPKFPIHPPESAATTGGTPAKKPGTGTAP